jgi:hypothetical protein
MVAPCSGEAAAGQLWLRAQWQAWCCAGAGARLRRKAVARLVQSVRSLHGGARCLVRSPQPSLLRALQLARLLDMARAGGAARRSTRTRCSAHCWDRRAEVTVLHLRSLILTRGGEWGVLVLIYLVHSVCLFFSYCFTAQSLFLGVLGLRLRSLHGGRVRAAATCIKTITRTHIQTRMSHKNKNKRGAANSWHARTKSPACQLRAPGPGGGLSTCR